MIIPEGNVAQPRTTPAQSTQSATLAPKNKNTPQNSHLDKGHTWVSKNLAPSKLGRFSLSIGEKLLPNNETIKTVQKEQKETEAITKSNQSQSQNKNPDLYSSDPIIRGNAEAERDRKNYLDDRTHQEKYNEEIQEKLQKYEEKLRAEDQLEFEARRAYEAMREDTYYQRVFDQLSLLGINPASMFGSVSAGGTRQVSSPTSSTKTGNQTTSSPQSNNTKINEKDDKITMQTALMMGLIVMRIAALL